MSVIGHGSAPDGVGSGFVRARPSAGGMLSGINGGIGSGRRRAWRGVRMLQRRRDAARDGGQAWQADPRDY